MRELGRIFPADWPLELADQPAALRHEGSRPDPARARLALIWARRRRLTLTFSGLDADDL